MTRGGGGQIVTDSQFFYWAISMPKLPLSAKSNGEFFFSHECFQQTVTSAKWQRQVGGFRMFMLLMSTAIYLF